MGNITPNDIMAALRAALPVELQSIIPQLTLLLTRLAAHELTNERAEAWIKSEPDMAEALKVLASERRDIPGVQITADGSQMGDLSIGDVVGGNKIEISITFAAPGPAPAVSAPPAPPSLSVDEITDRFLIAIGKMEAAKPPFPKEFQGSPYTGTIYKSLDGLNIALIGEDKTISELYKRQIGRIVPSLQIHISDYAVAPTLIARYGCAIALIRASFLHPQGFEAIKFARSLNQNIYIICTTSLESLGSVEEAKRSGAHRVLMKPFDPSRLVEILRDPLRP